eukprot:m.79212 g.79212  ORF g.79212 m.79212 type:complete len:50 (-) comp10784_c0_seq2:158-307(-)
MSCRNRSAVVDPPQASVCASPHDHLNRTISRLSHCILLWEHDFMITRSL